MAEIRELPLSVPRTARYYTLGEPESQLGQVWFICHGYGQLGRYFLKHLECVDDGSRLIVAAEGFSRFYLQGFDGRIGASWMTSEDRLNEIHDYVGYLDAIYDEIFDTVSRAEVEVVGLGFSQGTATVCRWLDQGRANADRLILWAGFMPPEIDLSAPRSIFQDLSVSFVVGKQDEYANPAIIAEQEAILNANNISFERIDFDGGHALDPAVLNRLANK